MFNGGKENVSLFVQEYPCVGFYFGESHAAFCADER